MRLSRTLAVAIAALGMLATLGTARGESSKVRIGVFDSRSVAIAYYRSDEFKQHLANLHAKLEQAKASSDEDRVKRLESQGRTLQELVHNQGFGNRRVGNILKKIKGGLSAIAKTADVDVIVSKWDIAYKQPEVKFVDITDQLVKTFNPSKETLEVIKNVEKKRPVPAEKLKGEND